MLPVPRYLKPFLLASTALVVASGAQAAPPSVNWSGCYIGGHVGAGSSGTDIFDPNGIFFAPLGAPAKVRSEGALGGAQIGCDQQFIDKWLLGAAADFSWAHIAGQVVDPFFASKAGHIVPSAENDWLATATVRVGYVWDRLLLYGKGGAAWTHGKYQVSGPIGFGSPVVAACTTFFCNPAGDKVILGWVLGLGAEWAFAKSWSIAMEFDHYDFGTHTITITDPNGVPVPASGPINVKQRIEAVKISLNYRFGGP